MLFGTLNLKSGSCFCIADGKLFRPSIERMNSYAPQHSRVFKEVR